MGPGLGGSVCAQRTCVWVGLQGAVWKLPVACRRVAGQHAGCSTRVALTATLFTPQWCASSSGNGHPSATGAFAAGWWAAVGLARDIVAYAGTVVTPVLFR